MMPISLTSPGITSLSFCSRMNFCAAGRRSSTLSRSWVKITGGWASRPYSKRGGPEAMLAAVSAALVVLGGELAGDVAGAYAQIQHHRRMASLGQLETLFHHVGDGRQIGPRVK